MKVKLKDSSKVYYDREQKIALSGTEVIEVKATLHVRKLIGEGALVEVISVGGELSDADKAKAAEAKLNDEAKQKAEEAKKAEAAKTVKVTK